MNAKDASMMRINNISKARPVYPARQSVLFLGVTTAVLATVVFAIRVKGGLSSPALPDELEQFVIARMLIRGAHLYRDVFSHHGPLPYMVSHLYALAVSQSDFSYIRIWQAILALASCASAIFCPVLKTTVARIWVGALYLLLISSVWVLEGLNQLTYYTSSQFLFVIVVTQMGVPAIFGERRDSIGMFTAGIATALVFFCAYSNGIAAALFVLTSVPGFLLLGPNEENTPYRLKSFLLGLISAATVAGVWLLNFGDLVGYFVYHFYFNQHVYAAYIQFSFLDFLGNFSFSFAPQQVVHGFALSLFFCWLYIFTIAQNEKDSRQVLAAKLMALLLTAAGVVFTNPRGPLVNGGQGFVAANFALFSVGSGVLLERGLSGPTPRGILRTMLLWAVVLALAAKIDGYATPFDGIRDKGLSKPEENMKPALGGIYNFVRRITRKDGDLLALNYGANIYFSADRIPASGNLFYLPWQATYNRKPMYGYKLDICKDIRSSRPAVIWFFNWRVWGKYSLDDYEPCVLSLIADGYTPLRFDSPWYIRNDLFAIAVATVPEEEITPFDFFGYAQSILRLSEPLESFSPIKIMMSPTHMQCKTALRRIGVLFGTHGGQVFGEAELHLKGSNGVDFSHRFSVSAVPDSKYYFFDVDSKWYTAGEIRSQTATGISTWESHFDSDPYTCLIYEYVDGTKRYTPACPIK